MTDDHSAAEADGRCCEHLGLNDFDTTELLDGAAWMWIAEEGADEALDLLANYSTTRNEFLHQAEAAWRRAVEATAEFEATRRAAEAARTLDQTVPEREWGVYHLIDAGDRVFYVGMTGTPSKRLRAHLKEFGDRIADVAWHPVETRVQAFDLETEHIALLLPPLNIMKVPEA